MMPTLDVNNPSQVTSSEVLDVFLGIPQQHLLIFTGVAIPEYDTDEHYLRRRGAIDRPISFIHGGGRFG